MRLDINLASQPYEDARVFWLRWGTALGVLSIFTLALGAITITSFFAARHDHDAITNYHAQIAQRDRTREQAQEFLNRPENRSTRDQSQFLNELIERKSLSWTRVLEDLEKVMPPRVHVVSIAPALDEDNQLKLKMVVGGDSREKAIELAQRMEESHHFAQTYIETEHSANEPGSGDRVQFDIDGIYLPESDTTGNAIPPAAVQATPKKTPKRSQP